MCDRALLTNAFALSPGATATLTRSGEWSINSVRSFKNLPMTRQAQRDNSNIPGTVMPSYNVPH